MKNLWIIFCFSVITLQSSIQAEKGLFSSEKKGADLFKWIKTTKSELDSKSKLATTAAGPIEYVKKGNGPVVLCLHGAPGGYDQSLLIGSNLIRRGFTVLAVSRPGYLRTPISVGQSIEEQADALKALLDTLHISKVAVLGFSAGGPVALEFALRYPERTWGVVLESIGVPTSDTAMYEIYNLLLSSGTVPDYGPWLFYLSTRLHAKTTAKVIIPLDTYLTNNPFQKRIGYILSHKNQLNFFKQLMYSVIPLSLRQVGLNNDINGINPWLSFPYGTLTIPTIIVQARDDSNGSYIDAQSIASQIPQAQLITVEGSGHLIWLGKETHKWENQVANFLKSLKP